MKAERYDDREYYLPLIEPGGPKHALWITVLVLTIGLGVVPAVTQNFQLFVQPILNSLGF